MDETKDITYLKSITRRRKGSFGLFFLMIFIVSVVVAFILPSIYLSKSTILIEGQQIPTEYVQSTITGYVEERLQIITQQIMTSSRLMEIIRRFDLYHDMREGYTVSEIIEEMRDDINLETISADVRDRRTGRPTSATIAFALSYEGKDPSKVQKVANVLASLYLEENLRSREQRATNTTTFLQEELNEIKGQIDSIQNKISEFKKDHLEELPEYTPINIQTLGRLDNDISRIDMQINALKERKILLEGQIANVKPLTPIVTEDGKTMMNPSERLKYLRLQLISLQGIMSDKHPDIIKLNKEIRELEVQVGESDDSIKKIRLLDELKGKLAAIKGKKGAKHPDVIKLSKQVKVLSREVENLKTEKITHKLSEQKPDNPAYINLETQTATAELDIRNLLKERLMLKEEKARYRKKIENSPLVEKEYNNLLRDYEIARYKYNELMGKHMEAKVAQGMEETQQGERFTIVDPAQFPEKPYKPNRLAIILVGFVLALGSGVGVAAALESLDTSIKTADQIGSFTQVPVLSVISRVESEDELKARRKKRIILSLAAVAVVIAGLFIINQFIMPLDILWIKLQRKMTMTRLL